MADFALGVVASEPALGLKAGEFMKAYERNQEEATGLALSASPLFEPVKAFIIAKSGNFAGTATELLNQLNLTVDEKTSKARGWPKAPNALTNQLRRLAPNLRRVGIAVEWPPRTSGEKTVTIVMEEKPHENPEQFGDDEDQHDIARDFTIERRQDPADNPGNHPVTIPSAHTVTPNPAENKGNDACNGRDDDFPLSSEGEITGEEGEL